MITNRITNEKIEKIVRLLKESGEGFIFCAPVTKDDGKSCFRTVMATSGDISLIEMLDPILIDIIETGKDNGADKDLTKMYFHAAVDEAFNDVYGDGENNAN